MPDIDDVFDWNKPLTDKDGSLRDHIRQNIEQFIASLNERGALSNVEYDYDPATGIADITFDPVPVQDITITPRQSAFLRDIDVLEAYNTLPSISHSYTPSDPPKITTMYDSIDEIAANTKAMLTEARNNPVTKDLVISLMERFAGLILEAHGIDSTIDIHAIEIRPKSDI